MNGDKIYENIKAECRCEFEAAFTTRECRLDYTKLMNKTNFVISYRPSECGQKMW